MVVRGTVGARLADSLAVQGVDTVRVLPAGTDMASSAFAAALADLDLAANTSAVLFLDDPCVSGSGARAKCDGSGGLKVHGYEPRRAKYRGGQPVCVTLGWGGVQCLGSAIVVVVLVEGHGRRAERVECCHLLDLFGLRTYCHNRLKDFLALSTVLSM